MSDPPFTPEHLQLLSPKHLEAAARDDAAPASDADEAAERAARSRMARYEIRRRRCEVPVRDRYACVDRA